MSGVGFFSSNLLHEVVAKHYASRDKHFYTLRVDEGFVIPLVEHTISMVDLGMVSVTRLATAVMADYFAFPQHEELTATRAASIVDKTKTDAVVFSHVDQKSVAHEALRNAGGVILPCQSTRGLTCLSVNEYLATLSHSMRRTFKKKIKNASTNGEFALAECDTMGLNWLLQVQRSRARQGKYEVLADDASLVSTLRELVASHKVLQARYLVGYSTAASLLIFPNDSTWSIYAQAFDARYARLSPSLATIFWLITEAVRHGVTYIDLLRGNEPYKQNFAKNEIPLSKFLFVKNPDIEGKIETYVRIWEE